MKFFEKIKQWFLNIGKNTKMLENKPEEGISNNETQDKKEEFKLDLHVENNDQILKLQKDLREGNIKQEDLTDEQIDKLIELYNTQIEEINKKIEEKQKRIDKISKKNQVG